MKAKNCTPINIDDLIQGVANDYAKARGKSQEDALEIAKDYISSFLATIEIGGRREYPLLGPKRGDIVRISENQFCVRPLPLSKRGRRVSGRSRKLMNRGTLL